MINKRNKNQEFIFVVGEDVGQHPKRLTRKRAQKIHEDHVTKKVKVRAIGYWRNANINNINIHDRVRLIKDPSIEGEIRKVLKNKEKVEVCHMGSPRFIQINKLKIWIRKKK